MLRPFLSTFSVSSAARTAGRLLAVALLGMAAVSCSNSTVPAPEQGLEYYPIAVGNFWTYAVTDSSWTQASVSNPTSTLRADTYQFRETIISTFTDAASETAYRMVRAKRVPPATEWKDDSVFTLSATPHTVVLNRNNLRSVELIFPVREGHLWNANAFNNNSNDTITAETRRYSKLGQPLTTTVGGVSQTYPLTLTTTDEGKAKEEDSYYTKTYRQVYAKGVGPVQRQRRRFARYYNISSGGTVTFVPNAFIYGFSRTETLVDYGPR